MEATICWLSVGSGALALRFIDKSESWLHRELFEQVDWSTERVLEQTKQRAAEIDVEVKLLPVGYDVDDRAALRRLCGELLGENSREALAPNTRKFLTEIIEREGRHRIWPL